MSSSKKGMSRRDFIRGTTLGAVTTGLLPTGILDPAHAAETPILGPGPVEIALRVNGKARSVRVEPRVTLLDALRNDLDVTGAKRVCDRGTCGACTMVVDGVPVYACSMLAVEARGKSIETIEGLGTPDSLHPVQKAFVEHDGLQCGFCTPGFVMACAAFLKTNPNPSAEDVKKGLGGNLCRCGTYAGIRAAVLDAAKAGGKGAS